MPRREVMLLEKITYSEAREWFWVRTAGWLIPAVLVSAAAYFFYSGEYFSRTAARVEFALGAGAAAVLLGLAAAAISIQLPWMRTGRWYGFALNGPFCAFASGFLAFVIFGLVIALLQRDTFNLPSGNLIDALYKLDIFDIGASSFWGFCLGSWFALRRDRYFVEPI